MPFIDYTTLDSRMQGYEQHAEEDRTLRAQDPAQFLRRRIFAQHPEPVRAVGFKGQYLYVSHDPRLMPQLVADKSLRVIHLKRKNLLRLLTSLRIAQSTGRWFEGDPKAVIASKLTKRNTLRALRRPWRAVARIRQIWQRRARPPVHISSEELQAFFQVSEQNAAYFDELFSEHRTLDVQYEDLARNQDGVFDEIQTFLGVDPEPLTVTLRKQNPDPLRKLIANYDELHAAFTGTPYEPFFEA